MTEIRTIPPKLTLDEWNALLDHSLEKEPSYIIRINGSYIEAISGTTGEIFFRQTDASTVIQAVVDALPSGGLIFFKKGLYLLTTEIDSIPSDLITFEGEERRATILRATAAMNSMINGRNKFHIVVRNISLEGGGLAIRGIDFSNDSSAAREHHIDHVFVDGYTECGLDLTGSEDSVVRVSRFHGSIGGVAPFGNYGIIIGGTGGVHTNGLVSLHECICGFNHIADIKAVDHEQVRIFGGVLASLPTDDADMVCELMLGNCGIVECFGTWFEGSAEEHSVPNIKIVDSPCRELGLFGVRMFGNTFPNIYSDVLAPNRALWNLVISGGVIEPRGDNYAVQCPTYNLEVNSSDMVCGSSDLVDLTNVYLYWLNSRGDSFIKTNKTIKTEGDSAIIEGATDKQLKITAKGTTGGGLLLNYGSTRPIYVGGNVDGVGPDLIRLTPVAGDVHCDKDLNLQGTMRIKNPLSYNDATLSGTPKIVEIVVGNDVYYFKVYPTKT